MSTVNLSRQAQAQLAEIIRTTARRWGPAQADAYRVALRECFTAMAGGTALMRQLEGPGGPYWRHRCRHHVIFAIRTGEVLRIVQILHERMDAPTRLTREP